MYLLNLAKRVKAGARFLDKKVPQWRQVMRKNDDQFNLADGECCILGTLEHKVGRLRVAAKKFEGSGYEKLLKLFKIEDVDESLGFDTTYEDDYDWGSNSSQYEDLEALWRAEYQK